MIPVYFTREKNHSRIEEKENVTEKGKKEKAINAFWISFSFFLCNSVFPEEFYDGIKEIHYHIEGVLFLKLTIDFTSITGKNMEFLLVWKKFL